ncbi:SDR family oxidoreductase [uncultured Arthrobacter sp.]|uniref:SDR family oxidoreductase n=1 Tax=uncultured Arthrobacter sp. TaxID=114050 RepID=UPI0025F6D848|nr:SDR family oxidoreductase [uncultured Arthrobacter sp.]
MRIQGSTVLVTGANRGLGRLFVEELLERGAVKVYAASRSGIEVSQPGVVPVALDITDPAAVAAAAAAAQDVNILINNAGILTPTSLLEGSAAAVRQELETNFFGTLEMTRAFAPVIAANGGGAIHNVLSVLSWAHFPDVGAYSAAKAASWAMTNAARQELAPQGIAVSALHVGWMDTDMGAHVPAEQKSDPAEVVSAALDAVEDGEPEVLFGELTHNVREALAGDLSQLYPDITVRELKAS